MSNLLQGLVLVVVVACVPTDAVRAAESSDDDAEEQILVEDLKAQEDPTILNSRAWLEAEWNNDRHDASSF